MLTAPILVACAHLESAEPRATEAGELLVEGIPRSARVGETVTFWAGFRNENNAPIDFVELSFSYMMHNPEGESYQSTFRTGSPCLKEYPRHRLREGSAYLALVAIRPERAGTKELWLTGKAREVSKTGECTGPMKRFKARLEFVVVE